MERVKNYKVRDFYKDKRYNPPIISAYMKTKYGQITKGYIDFAKICATKGDYIKPNEKENEQQLKNYHLLKKCVDHSDYETYNLSFLNEIKDIPIFNINLEKKDEPNQKWHLYISVFAQSIIGAPEFWEKSFKKYPCLQLKLWMAEKAGLDVEKIGEAIKNNANKKEINDLVKRISWDDIFEKIR